MLESLAMRLAHFTIPAAVLTVGAVSHGDRPDAGPRQRPAAVAPLGEGVRSASVPAARTDPFSRLPPPISRDRVAPLRSVRPRNRTEQPDPAKHKKITVMVRTSPSGAKVVRGRTTLGVTPLRLVAPPDSTPLDIVIRRPGYMALRTRIQRRASRTYAFKLTPAKLH